MPTETGVNVLGVRAAFSTTRKSPRWGGDLMTVCGVPSHHVPRDVSTTITKLTRRGHYGDIHPGVWNSKALSPCQMRPGRARPALMFD